MPAPGDDRLPRSANAVDNLGPTSLPTSPASPLTLGARKSRRRDSRFNPKLPDHELRLLGACGKERTGFPQGGAAQPVEIHYPVDPEIRKRCYTLIAFSSTTISA